MWTIRIKESLFVRERPVWEFHVKGICQKIHTLEFEWDGLELVIPYQNILGFYREIPGEEDMYLPDLDRMP